MPTYRQRLRLEGGALALCGLCSAIAVISASSTATRGPISTVVQLAVVAVAMATLGRRAVLRALAAAVDLGEAPAGSGEPTAVWKLPVIVAGLTLGFGFAVGWDAGLRIGVGCVIVGLAQAVLFERLVAAEEARQARRYYRVPGSRILTGTRLGSRSREPAATGAWDRSS